MHGLIRVRQFTLSDGHIVCTPEQLEEEFRQALDLCKYMIRCMGFEDEISYRFSKWDPKNKDKYVGTAEPVSYTHLDVYKRQIWIWSSTAPIVRRRARPSRAAAF